MSTLICSSPKKRNRISSVKPELGI